MIGNGFGDYLFHKKKWVFVWRASNDIIPARVTLMNHLGGNPCCPLCEVMVETTAHVFFECRCTAHIWQMSPFNLRLPKERIGYGANLLVVACVVCWRIWWWRNQVVNGGRVAMTEDLIEWASHFIEAYHTAQLPQVKR